MSALIITPDMAHVLLDVVNESRRHIDAGTFSPWSDYDGDADDPQTTRQGWLRLLNLARTSLEDIASDA